MPGYGVDTALPEGFLREKLLETRGELYHHKQASDQRAASSPQLITGTYMPHISSMSSPTFGSLIDLYRGGDAVDGLFSSLRISPSTSTACNNTACNNNNNINNNHSSNFLTSSPQITAQWDKKHNLWDTTDTIHDDKAEYKKRSSSLKSTRTKDTNTGGAGEKKIVRFADVLGLDLADVHTFLDEIPRIPKSAFKDLKNIDLKPSTLPVYSSRHHDVKNLVPLFSQPAAQGWFTERLARNKVCLENAFVTNTGCLNVRGTVRVVNISYEKGVTVRYTCDKWKTNCEALCNYVDGSSDGYSDRFGFTIRASNLNIGQRIEFALKYSVSGEEFWDNNDGANYSYQCVPNGPLKPVTSAYVSPTSALETWGSFY